MKYPRDLSDWLAYLENLHTCEIDLGLERLSNVWQNLKFPKPANLVITVAGTNGKGSTVALLEDFYLRANFRVASFTSPHLLKFNERIRILGKNIDDESLIKAFDYIELNRNGISLTFFEYSLLAAWKIFSEQNLDILILEVGMGGRLDAVNLIPKDLAIITTVDYDHQAYLGDTLEKIAYEKAGIISNAKPVILGDAVLPANIREIAESKAAPVYQLGREFDIISKAETWDLITPKNTYLNLPYPNFHLHNTASGIMALELFAEFYPVKEELIHQSLINLKLAGRWQIKSINGVTIVLDVAHNPQAMQNLARMLQNQGKYPRTYGVFGALKDKDFRLNFEILEPMIEHWVAVELPVPRTASRQELTSCLSSSSFIFAEQPISGFYRALEMAKPGDRVVICGSFYLVGPILAHLSEKAL